MKEVRCTHCRKLLAMAEGGQLEIKCTRCKTINKVTAKSCQPEYPRASSTRGTSRAKANAQTDRLS